MLHNKIINHKVHKEMMHKEHREVNPFVSFASNFATSYVCNKIRNK
jgi:hypothetical protein